VARSSAEQEELIVSFVVGTWNVQWQFGDWKSRQPAVAGALAALDADVITLQETWPAQVSRLADELGYEHVWAGHQKDDDPERGMGNAILSRWPIAQRAHRFLTDNKGREYRTIVQALIDSPAAQLPVFTTHIDHRFDQSATRVQQLQAASAFIEEHTPKGGFPPILTGDFNAVHDSDEIRRLTGRSTPYVAGRIWTDAWEQVGAGPGLTWSKENPYINNSAWPNRRLDYVLVGWPREQRPAGNPQRAWLFGTEAVDGVMPSDHYGVAVEIETLEGS